MIENAGEGTDRAITSLDNYVLGAHVEELTSFIKDLVMQILPISIGMKETK